jgi:hypothetical protein
MILYNLKKRTGIIYFMNGEHYLIANFSEKFDVYCIIDELKKFYSKLFVEDKDIPQDVVEKVKTLDENFYIKDGEVLKMYCSTYETRNLDIEYRVEILCGGDTAHVHPINKMELDFKNLSDKFSNYDVFINPITLNVRTPSTSLVIFRDGRVLMRSQHISEAIARNIYEKILFVHLI